MKREESKVVHYGKMLNNNVATLCGTDIVENMHQWSHTVKGLTCNKCIMKLGEELGRCKQLEKTNEELVKFVVKQLKFHEEMTVDGIVYYRNTPRGEWMVKKGLS
jgi:hypothetical protein